MARCDYCGTSILFGGVKTGEHRFCNDNCHQMGYLLSIADQLPEQAVLEQVVDVHQGNCPNCGQPGPVDVHVSHRVWSLVYVTSWRSQPHVCCRRCGIKSQLGAATFSFFLGWWGMPFGLFVTPVQLVRNFKAMLRPPDSNIASEELEKAVRLHLAAQVAMAMQEEQAAADDPDAQNVA